MRSKEAYFTIFRNIIMIVDWIGFGTLFILAIATVKESWEAYLNSATSWTVERNTIQHQPTFYLVFGLSVKMIDFWKTIDLSRPYPYHLKLGRDFNITFTANSKR